VNTDMKYPIEINEITIEVINWIDVAEDWDK
jgi:hypothetical protein